MFCKDVFWNDSAVKPSDGYPRVSECFRNTVLTFVLTCLILIALCILLKTCHHSGLKVQPKFNFSWFFVFSSSLCLVVCMVIRLIIGLKATPQITSTIVSSILHVCNMSLICAFQLLLFVHYVRNRCFLSLLWTVYFLCWLPNVYESLLFDDRLASIDVTICSLIIAELLVCMLIIPDKNENISSQSEQSCLFSNLLMVDVLSVLIKGYRNVLTLQQMVEMPDVINFKKCCSSEPNFKNLKFIKIVWNIFFWRYFTQTVLLTLYFVMRHVITAILLGLIIDCLRNSEPLWKQYFYTALMSVVLIISSIIYSHATMNLFIIGNKIKTMIIVCVYQKLLRVYKYEIQEVSSGALINLLIVDTERLVIASKFISYGIASILMAIVAFITLYFYIGYAAVATAVTFVALVPVYSFINNRSSKHLSNVLKLKSDRLKTASEILSGIKIIKLHAWEHAITNKLDNIRSLEYAALRKFGLWQGLLRGVTFNGAFLIAVIGYTVYSFVYDVVVIDVKIMFSSFSLFLSFRQAGFLLPEMNVMVSQANNLFNNLNGFFELPELSENAHSNTEHCAIILQNASFKRTLHDNLALQNISMSLEGNNLFIIIGPVGSGKSTLLEAMLGELKLVQGICRTGTSIAYVAQVAWMQDTTIKQNILFANNFNHQKYQEVLAVCCLNDDLKALSDGDETIIGEQGVQLSGGQKQRISIARAIYQDCDIYLLDDPFSALDSEVEMNVFQSVFGETGILKNKLRILVTNNLNLTQHANSIYLLNDGQVVYQGTSCSLHNQINQEFKKHDNSEIRYLSSKNFLYDFKTQNFDENVEKGAVTARTFINYTKNFGSYTLVLTLTMAIISIILEMFSGYWLSVWTKDKTDSSYQTRNTRLGVFALIVTFAGITFTIASFLIYTNIPKANTRIHDKMLNSIFHSSLHFFNRTPTGRILNRFGNDIDQLDMQSCLASVVLQFICQLLGLFIITFLVIPLFVLPAVLLLLFFAMVQRVTVVSHRQCKRLESVTRSSIANHLIETIQGIDSIRAFRTTDMFAQKTEQLCHNNAKCVYYTRAIESCVIMYTSLFTDFILTFLMIYMLKNYSSADQGTLIFVICYAVSTVFAFALMVSHVNEFESTFISAERLFEYCSLPSEPSWRIDNKLVSELWPKHGEIKFCNYTSCYETRLQPVLKNINLTIASGKKVGIVGRTGAGKSSLILSLFRVLEATEGFICIGGVDISTIGLHDLRSKLTIIPQDPVLFSGTLRTNLDLTNSHTDEELFEAVKAAHIENLTLKNGLDTAIDEFGENLSIGQRQLLCLARAILNKTKIVVMDEATSSVDLQTESLIQMTITEHFDNCTVLMIAHRIQTIINYDAVIVLDHGAVVEMGNPRELIQKKNTRFAKLAFLNQCFSNCGPETPGGPQTHL